MCPTWHFLSRANQGATLAGVSYKELERSLIDHQPPSQSFAVGLAALSKLADDVASLIIASWEPNVMIASQTLKLFSRSDYVKNAGRGVGVQLSVQTLIPGSQQRK